MHPLRLLIPVLTLAAVGAVAQPPRAADNWPDFRGPAGDGHSHGRNIPLEWSETRNVRWKIPVAGRAWSSPVVWGKQVWLTTATPDGHEMSVLCVDLPTGKVLLNRVLFRNAELEEPGPGHDSNSFASPSPVIEEGRVYLHFGKYGTACLDTRTFRTLWERRDLLCTHSAGPGSSPVLYRDRLFLTFDGIDVQYVAALDTKTGRTLWKTPRSVDWAAQPPPANTDVQQRKAFSTPFLTLWQGKPLLISTGAKATCGYDADTGRELWKVTYTGFSNAARPLAADGLAYLTTGYQRADLLAVRLGGSGDVTESHLAWKVSKNVPLNPSPLLHEGLLYLVNSGGIVTCLEAKSGEPVWQERLPGPFSASPTLIEGRIFLFNENGRAYILEPGRTFRKVAENALDDGMMASPAAVGSSLILRTKTHLYHIQAAAP